MVTLVRDSSNAAMPTEMMAPGTTENEPVISATMIMIASGARATLPKQAIIPTTTKIPGSCGTPGTPAGSAGADRQRRGDDLGDRQDEDDPQRDRHQRCAVGRQLRPAIAAAQDL